MAEIRVTKQQVADFLARRKLPEELVARIDRDLDDPNSDSRRYADSFLKGLIELFNPDNPLYEPPPVGTDPFSELDVPVDKNLTYVERLRELLRDFSARAEALDWPKERSEACGTVLTELDALAAKHAAEIERCVQVGWDALLGPLGELATADRMMQRVAIEADVDVEDLRATAHTLPSLSEPSRRDQAASFLQAFRRSRRRLHDMPRTKRAAEILEMWTAATVPDKAGADAAASPQPNETALMPRIAVLPTPTGQIKQKGYATVGWMIAASLLLLVGAFVSGVKFGGAARTARESRISAAAAPTQAIVRGPNRPKEFGVRFFNSGDTRIYAALVSLPSDGRDPATMTRSNGADIVVPAGGTEAAGSGILLLDTLEEHMFPTAGMIVVYRTEALGGELAALVASPEFKRLGPAEMEAALRRRYDPDGTHRKALVQRLPLDSP